MRKNMAGIAAVLLGVLAGAGTLLCASTGAPQTAAKTAPAADTPFAAFVKKVVAGAPGNLASLKGAETEDGKKHHDEYQGTVTPDADTPCRLSTQHMRDGREVPWLYDCNLGPRRSFEEAKPVYEKAAAELRASFPQWKFEESRLGDEAKRTELWDLHAERPGFTLRLEMRDHGAMEEWTSGQASGKPGVVVEFSVSPNKGEHKKTVTLPRKTAALAQAEAKPAIYTFIEKVLAAKADGYATLRGPSDNETMEMFKGKLAPDNRSTCSILAMMPKVYSCELGKAKSIAEIKTEYEQVKAWLQASYPDIEFKEEMTGSADWDSERWAVSGHNDRVSLVLRATDNFSTVRYMPEEQKKTPVELGLSIRAIP